MSLAKRMARISPFRVMKILARARELEASGQEIIHMEVGEPDFPSPPQVVTAGLRALERGETHYTPATGLPALREAIAAYYRSRFDVEVPAERIVVTPGASGALQLALAAVVNAADEVVIPDPGYPCNRNIAAMLGARVVDLPLSGDAGYQIEPAALTGLLGAATRMVMLASPANPTGNVITNRELRELLGVIESGSDAYLLVDEIYQGLQYEGAVETALSLDSERIIVINSFSKFFGMTGWRVGWMVVPQELVEPVDRLAQNLFLAASTPGQHAALAAFDPDCMALLEDRRDLFRQRRDFLFDALGDLGFGVGQKPAGAFYLHVDASRFTDNSEAFCADMLESAGIAATPGTDFGTHRADNAVRFAYTTSIEQLDEGVARLRRFLQRHRR